MQATEKKGDGVWIRLPHDFPIKKLTVVFIEKAREHFRNKANPIQASISASNATEHANANSQASTAASSATERAHAHSQASTAASDATEHANANFCIQDMAEALHYIRPVGQEVEVLVRIVDYACNSQQCISCRVAAMFSEANWNI